MKLGTCEGRRKNETREQGLSRRAKEARARTMEFVRKFREDEERRRAVSLALVEKALGGYDDRPL